MPAILWLVNTHAHIIFKYLLVKLKQVEKNGERNAIKVKSTNLWRLLFFCQDIFIAIRERPEKSENIFSISN